MGYPSISGFGAQPFFNSLISENALASNVFSFYLANQSAELALGGVNPAKYQGAITWSKVTKKGYWQIAMDGAGVFGTNPFAVKGLQAIIDSGTSYIVGDMGNVKTFYAAIPGSKDATATVAAGYYTGLSPVL